ncbi:hypothetical protein [Nocardia higoensis]|uniref:hypothetical protein n=1 Tax=Nocardia higoensis TaxID=228599 RepID=UPI001E3EB153|nr:hypothetical protein [Nocardia higoensis]
MAPGRHTSAGQRIGAGRHATPEGSTALGGRTGGGRHRAVGPSRRRVGLAVAAGAAPVVLTLTGTGPATADVEYPAAVTEEAPSTGTGPGSPKWPAAEAPNVRPYHGIRIPDDTLSSLQWARPVPEPEYLSPVEELHAPVPVAPVPPIAPPPEMLRFGDVRVEPPEWLPREHAIQLNDAAAVQEAELATFLDSVGMERTRSDRVASQTIGAAALGAAAGAAVASPFALIGAGAGGAMGMVIGLPFAPIGLAAVPVGAAYGAALMAAPLAVIGAGVGATVGAAQALTAPPRALGPAPV